MNITSLGLLLASIMFSVAGQFFLKLGALKLGRGEFVSAIERILNIFLTPELIAGLICYGLGAVAYILLLTKIDLSMAAPAVSLVYVFSIMLGYFWFQEAIPPSRIIGMGFIVCGVILVAWK